jgi:hypothetical protein
MRETPPTHKINKHKSPKFASIYLNSMRYYLPGFFRDFSWIAMGSPNLQAGWSPAKILHKAAPGNVPVNFGQDFGL